MSRASLIILLAEDRRQQAFAQRYLERLGYRADQIQPEPLPTGEGSGELWVRQRYAINVSAYRNRATRAATALMVVIDADTEPLSKRITQLAEALAGAGVSPRTADDKISCLVPKRNIETWILCLNGHSTDEETDYSRGENFDRLIKPAAMAFFDGMRVAPKVPSHWVDSLRKAVNEVRSLD